MEVNVAGLKNTKENVVGLELFQESDERCGQGHTQGSCQGLISHSEDLGHS